MNQDQTIAVYESVADITSKMLAAARNSDWDGLCTLETDCASQVRMLKSIETTATSEKAEKGVPMTNATRLRKRALIEKILADDREIRQLTECWTAQLSNLLNRPRVERQLSMAYGSHQTY
ncbi:flagellar protein FliT [Rhodoferax sp. PAMC 29310]|uniref:flagellar protein FliT n=1 Tax=Rhodoferax sp. PAMC 29310 TaxID=2822760 RepID=UPI001B31A6A3|nr:flagellar protein FliT [Rhodoferax sp. PAMC 29310]